MIGWSHFSDQEKLLKFEVEGWEFSKFLRSLEQFIQTVKGQNNFGNKKPFPIKVFMISRRIAFSSCSWRFLRSNELEELEFRLEKIVGI